MKREQKKQELRNRILLIACQLFTEKGYDQTLLDEIYEQANISKRTFYNYFDSKESLLIALAEDVLLNVNCVIESQAPNRIERAIQQLIYDTFPCRQLTIHILSTCSLNMLKENFISSFLKSFSVLVEQEQQANRITTRLTAEEIATLILGVFYSAIFSWEDNISVVKADQMIKRLVGIIMDSIAPID